MLVLLNTGSLDINASGLVDPPICRAVEKGHLEAVRLLMQHGGRLQINWSTITAHNTALCIAASDGNSEMVRALLRHDLIDSNLQDRWFQAPQSLAATGTQVLVVDALLEDRRLSPYSITTALDFATNDCFRSTIQSKIGKLNARHVSGPVRSPRRRIGAFYKHEQSFGDS